MADTSTKQQVAIKVLETKMQHIIDGNRRIENMFIEHNKTHAALNATAEKERQENKDAIAGHGYWITAVKWGAGVLATLGLVLAPGVNKVINERPTDEQVVAIIRDQLAELEITRVKEN